MMEVQNTVNFNVLKHVMNLSVSEEAIPQVKAIANLILNSIQGKLESDSSAVSKEMVYRIKQFIDEPYKFEVIPSPQVPDGSPIGSFQCLSE